MDKFVFDLDSIVFGLDNVLVDQLDLMKFVMGSRICAG